MNDQPLGNPVMPGEFLRDLAISDSVPLVAGYRMRIEVNQEFRDTASHVYNQYGVLCMRIQELYDEVERLKGMLAGKHLQQPSCN